MPKWLKRVLPVMKQTILTFFQRFLILKGIYIVVLVEKLQKFCLMVELHREGSAPAACAAGLFINRKNYPLYLTHRICFMGL